MYGQWIASIKGILLSLTMLLTLITPVVAFTPFFISTSADPQSPQNLDARTKTTAEEENVDSFDVNPKSGRWIVTESGDGNVEDTIIDGNLRIITSQNTTGGSEYFMKRGLLELDPDVEYRYKMLVDNLSFVELYRDVLGDSADFEEDDEDHILLVGGSKTVSNGVYEHTSAGTTATVMYQSGFEVMSISLDLIEKIEWRMRSNVSNFNYNLELWSSDSDSAYKIFAANTEWTDYIWEYPLSDLSGYDTNFDPNGLFYSWKFKQPLAQFVQTDIEYIKVFFKLDYATFLEGGIENSWDWQDSAEYFTFEENNVSDFEDGTTEDWTSLFSTKMQNIGFFLSLNADNEYYYQHILQSEFFGYLHEPGMDIDTYLSSLELPADGYGNDSFYYQQFTVPEGQYWYISDLGFNLSQYDGINQCISAGLCVEGSNGTYISNINTADVSSGVDTLFYTKGDNASQSNVDWTLDATTNSLTQIFEVPAGETWNVTGMTYPLMANTFGDPNGTVGIAGAVDFGTGLEPDWSDVKGTVIDYSGGGEYPTFAQQDWTFASSFDLTTGWYAWFFNATEAGSSEFVFKVDDATTENVTRDLYSPSGSTWTLHSNRDYFPIINYTVPLDVMNDYLQLNSTLTPSYAYSISDNASESNSQWTIDVINTPSFIALFEVPIGETWVITDLGNEGLADPSGFSPTGIIGITGTNAGYYNVSSGVSVDSYIPDWTDIKTSAITGSIGVTFPSYTYKSWKVPTVSLTEGIYAWFLNNTGPTGNDRYWMKIDVPADASGNNTVDMFCCYDYPDRTEWQGEGDTFLYWDTWITVNYTKLTELTSNSLVQIFEVPTNEMWNVSTIMYGNVSYSGNAAGIIGVVGLTTDSFGGFIANWTDVKSSLVIGNLTSEYPSVSYENFTIPSTTLGAGFYGIFWNVTGTGSYYITYETVGNNTRDLSIFNTTSYDTSWYLQDNDFFFEANYSYLSDDFTPDGIIGIANVTTEYQPSSLLREMNTTEVIFQLSIGNLTTNTSWNFWPTGGFILQPGTYAQFLYTQGTCAESGGSCPGGAADRRYANGYLLHHDNADPGSESLQTRDDSIITVWGYDFYDDPTTHQDVFVNFYWGLNYTEVYDCEVTSCFNDTIYTILRPEYFTDVLGNRSDFDDGTTEVWVGGSGSTLSNNASEYLQIDDTTSPARIDASGLSIDSNLYTNITIGFNSTSALTSIQVQAGAFVCIDSTGWSADTWYEWTCDLDADPDWSGTETDIDVYFYYSDASVLIMVNYTYLFSDVSEKMVVKFDTQMYEYHIQSEVNTTFTTQNTTQIDSFYTTFEIPYGEMWVIDSFSFYGWTTGTPNANVGITGLKQCTWGVDCNDWSSNGILSTLSSSMIPDLNNVYYAGTTGAFGSVEGWYNVTIDGYSRVTLGAGSYAVYLNDTSASFDGHYYTFRVNSDDGQSNQTTAGTGGNDRNYWWIQAWDLLGQTGCPNVTICGWDVLSRIHYNRSIMNADVYTAAEFYYSATGTYLFTSFNLYDLDDSLIGTSAVTPSSGTTYGLFKDIGADADWNLTEEGFKIQLGGMIPYDSLALELFNATVKSINTTVRIERDFKKDFFIREKGNVSDFNDGTSEGWTGSFGTTPFPVGNDYLKLNGSDTPTGGLVIENLGLSIDSDYYTRLVLTFNSSIDIVNFILIDADFNSICNDGIYYPAGIWHTYTCNIVHAGWIGTETELDLRFFNATHFVVAESVFVDSIYLEHIFDNTTYNTFITEVYSEEKISSIIIRDGDDNTLTVCDSISHTAGLYQLFQCDFSSESNWNENETLLDFQIIWDNSSALGTFGALNSTALITFVAMYDTLYGDNESWDAFDSASDAFSYVLDGKLHSRKLAGTTEYGAIKIEGLTIDADMFDRFYFTAKAETATTIDIVDSAFNDLGCSFAITTSWADYYCSVRDDSDWSGTETEINVRDLGTTLGNLISFEYFSVAATGTEQRMTIGFWDDEDGQSLLNITQHWWNESAFRWEIEMYDDNWEIASYYYSDNQTLEDAGIEAFSSEVLVDSFTSEVEEWIEAGTTPFLSAVDGTNYILSNNTETLFVDGFTSTSTDWNTSGSSPYLDALGGAYIYVQGDPAVTNNLAVETYTPLATENGTIYLSLNDTYDVWSSWKLIQEDVAETIVFNFSVIESAIIYSVYLNLTSFPGAEATIYITNTTIGASGTIPDYTEILGQASITSIVNNTYNEIVFDSSFFAPVGNYFLSFNGTNFSTGELYYWIASDADALGINPDNESIIWRDDGRASCDNWCNADGVDIYFNFTRIGSASNWEVFGTYPWISTVDGSSYIKADDDGLSTGWFNFGDESSSHTDGYVVTVEAYILASVGDDDLDWGIDTNGDNTAECTGTITNPIAGWNTDNDAVSCVTTKSTLNSARISITKSVDGAPVNMSIDAIRLNVTRSASSGLVDRWFTFENTSITYSSDYLSELGVYVLEGDGLDDIGWEIDVNGDNTRDYWGTIQNPTNGWYYISVPQMITRTGINNARLSLSKIAGSTTPGNMTVDAAQLRIVHNDLQHGWFTFGNIASDHIDEYTTFLSIYVLETDGDDDIEWQIDTNGDSTPECSGFIGNPVFGWNSADPSLTETCLDTKAEINSARVLIIKSFSDVPNDMKIDAAKLVMTHVSTVDSSSCFNAYCRADIELDILKSEFEIEISSDGGTDIFDVDWTIDFTTFNTPEIFAHGIAPNIFVATHAEFYGHTELWLDFIDAKFLEQRWRQTQVANDSDFYVQQWQFSAAQSVLTWAAPPYTYENPKTSAIHKINVPRLDSFSLTYRPDFGNWTPTYEPTGIFVNFHVALDAVDWDDGEHHQIFRLSFNHIMKFSSPPPACSCTNWWYSYVNLWDEFDDIDGTFTPLSTGIETEGTYPSTYNATPTYGVSFALQESRKSGTLALRYQPDSRQADFFTDIVQGYDIPSITAQASQEFVITFTHQFILTDDTDVGSIKHIVEDFDFIERDFFQDIANFVGDVVGGILAPFINFLAGIFIAIFRFLAIVILSIIDPIVQGLGAIFTSVIAVLSSTLEAAISVLGPIIKAAVGALEPILQGIIDAFDPLLSLLDSLLGDLIDLLTNLLGDLIDVIIELAIDIVQAFVDLMEDIIEAILPFIGQIFDAIVNVVIPVFADVWDQVWTAIFNIIDPSGGLKEMVDEMVQVTIPELINTGLAVATKIIEFIPFIFIMMIFWIASMPFFEAEDAQGVIHPQKAAQGVVSNAKYGLVIPDFSILGFSLNLTIPLALMMYIGLKFLILYGVLPDVLAGLPI